MLVKNMTEFRKSMKDTLDHVSNNDDTLVISRPNDQDVVLISMKSFNSINETLYLMSSAKNHNKLTKAIDDIESAKNLVNKNLLV